MNQRKPITQEIAQHDDTATDAAILYADLRRLAYKDWLDRDDMQELRRATDMAYQIMARTDGTARLMRVVIRLIRRARLDRKTIAELKEYEQAYPNELARTADRVEGATRSPFGHDDTDTDTDTDDVDMALATTPSSRARRAG